MYLTRLILDPRSRRVQRELASPYELHRSLMRAFVEGYECGGERVLYRVEPSDDAAGVPLLVQSQRPPDWAFLQEPEARGYLTTADHPNPQTKPFVPQLAVGQVLAFRLRANPTVKRKGKRLGLYREEEQRAWLARKGGLGGFRVLRADVRQEGLLQGTIHHEQGSLSR
jgi:CRISPR system Cascade subunit CasE